MRIKKPAEELSIPLLVLNYLVKKYPNDADLGKEIRKQINNINKLFVKK